MNLSLRSLFFAISFFCVTQALNADVEGDKEAEQHRLDRIRQQQSIDQNHIEELHQETKRLEQDNINRQLERKRLDNARQERKIVEAQWERDHNRD